MEKYDKLSPNYFCHLLALLVRSPGLHCRQKKNIKMLNGMDDFLPSAHFSLNHIRDPGIKVKIRGVDLFDLLQKTFAVQRILGSMN